MTGVGQRVAETDPGHRRRRNEDAYVLQPPLFAVADGMGGAQAGEIASRLAASALEDHHGEGGGSGSERLVALIQEANRRVYERSSADEAVSGMGTTMTAALVDGDRVHIGHVGDSRAYRVRGGRLEQLTEDHSLVAELMRSGKLSPEEADVHPQRSVITRALGTDPYVDVDAFSVDAVPGDVFVLCSDGLTTMIDGDAILSIVEANRSDLGTAARALVAAANGAGGEDNITVVCFDFVESGVADSTQTMPVVSPDDVPVSREDDDTLSGVEGVPTIDDTILVRPDDWPGSGVEPAAATPRAPAPVRTPVASVPRRPRERRVSRVVLAVGSLSLVVILAALVVWGLSRSYFVGATPDGHIAVYQGFPWDLAGQVRLYRLKTQSDLLAAQLSQAERRDLFDHDLESYASALRKVRTYEVEGVP